MNASANWKQQSNSENENEKRWRETVEARSKIFRVKNDLQMRSLGKTAFVNHAHCFTNAVIGKAGVEVYEKVNNIDHIFGK